MPNVTAALTNIGGALYKSSSIPFLVPRRKVWLTPTVRVPCSNAANIGKRKTWTQSEFCTWQNPRRARAPGNVYSPGDGQTSCKVWLTSVERRRCSNEANTRNPLKYAGVPQTGKPISVANAPKFVILWGHVEEILLLNKFYPIVDTCLSCEDIARQSCEMVPRWRFFCVIFASCIFSEPRAAHFKPAF